MLSSMLRRALLVLLVALAGCKERESAPFSPANQPAPPRRADAPASTAPASPLLWRIERDGATSWLLGTMHVGVSARDALPAIVWQRLAETETFVAETDTSAIDPAAALSMARAPGPTLREQLTDEQWRVLVEALPAMPPATLAQLEPWFAIIWITGSLAPATDESMDDVLLSRAREQGATIVTLEPWRYQLEVLEESTGVDDLAHILDDLDAARDELTQLAAAYRAGDIEAIEAIVFDPAERARNPKLVDIVLVRRTEEWLPELERRLAAGGAFVAVGAGHVVGDRGLLALLRGRGYAVSRVTSPGTSAATGSGRPDSARAR